MVRKDLVSATTAKLKHDNIKKQAKVPRHVFHITDDDGNKKDFIVKGITRSVNYNESEIDVILDTLIDVALDAIKRGEDLYIREFGTFSYHYSPPKVIHDIFTGEKSLLGGRYILKFKQGNRLKSQVKLYNIWLQEQSGEDGESAEADWNEGDLSPEDGD